MGSRMPISPVRRDGDVDRAEAELGGGVLGGGVGVLEALGPGAGVGAAGVEDDGPRPLARRAPAGSRAPGRPGSGWW